VTRLLSMKASDAVRWPSHHGAAYAKAGAGVWHQKN